jgi:hypothetical protein
VIHNFALQRVSNCLSKGGESSSKHISIIRATQHEAERAKCLPYKPTHQQGDSCVKRRRDGARRARSESRGGRARSFAQP